MTLIKKPKIVLFDWDNTIVATHGIFSSVLSIVMRKLNLDHDIINSQKYKDTRNMSVRDSFPILFGENWQSIWNEYEKCYNEVLNEKGGVVMLPGAENFLMQLHEDGVLMGVVSNKNHDLLMNEVKMLGIEHLFISVVGSGRALADKPSAIHAQHAIDEIINLKNDLRITKEIDCWLVGDSDVDVSCAINTNCFPVLINSTDRAVPSKKYLTLNNVPHVHITSFDELMEKYKKLK